MSSLNPQPDLEDSIHESEAHGRVIREAAACVREKPLAASGSSPVPLGVLAACGLIFVIAGGILGGAGKLFDYGATFRAGYFRTPPPGVAEQGPPPKEALAAYMAKGAKVFEAKCKVCHGPEAKGDGAAFPSLVGSKWANGETQRFSQIILNGLIGPTSTGKAFPGAGMPTQAAGMAPEDLAGIMTYVRNHFGNTTGDVITVEMAKAAMEIAAKRSKAGQQVTAEELTADHVKQLPGTALDPKALVDPITLVPVKATKVPKP